MKPSSRFVAIVHWIAPVVLMLFLAFGRGLFGAPMGWMLAIVVWTAPLTLPALYIPPILTLFDRDVRTTKRARTAYSVATIGLWLSLIVLTFALVDGGDDGTYGSVLTTWGASDDVSGALTVWSIFVAAIALVAAFVLAVIGIVLSRQDRSVPGPPAGAPVGWAPPTVAPPAAPPAL